MKLIISSLTALLFSGALLSAQMPGMVTMQQSSASQGTTLGANTTSGAAGIALGNRVVMRGFVDFQFKYDDEDGGAQTEAFNTSSDIDFLFDFSPVTGEVHIALDPSPITPGKEVTLEQAFGRYSLNRDFNFSFGRQLTMLGYEADEAPGLFAVSNAYYLGDKASGAQTRRNYKDGVRANFNNGRFGLSLGLHDGYWVDDDFNGDNIALDIAASIMIIPGLEARVGYAHQTIDTTLSEDEISQFNTWVSYKSGDLTLAFEYDNFDILGSELWDVMLLGNYQMSNWLGLTLKYAHEDLEINTFKIDSDRFSLALLFTLTDNFGLNLEYSHSEADYDSGDADADEVSLQGLLTF